VTTRTDRLDEQRLYDVLSNERRRVCVRRLCERETAVPVQRLADELAEVVADGDQDEDGGFRRSVYISLVQTHLPKLHQYGVVEYDDEQKVVGPGEHLPEVEAQLSNDRHARVERLLTVGVILGSVGAVVALLFAYGRLDQAGRLAVSGALLLQVAVAVAAIVQFLNLSPDATFH